MVNTAPAEPRHGDGAPVGGREGDPPSVEEGGIVGLGRFTVLRWRCAIGLYELIDVKEAATRILGCQADVMTRRSLHRALRPQIEASALQVF
jgi:hypothetical protein